MVRGFAIGVVAVMAACASACGGGGGRAAAPVVGSAAAPAGAGAAPAESPPLIASPDETSMKYVLALAATAAGRDAEAVRWIRELVADGWTNGLPDDPFAKPRDPEIRRLVELLNARVPHVATSTVAFQIADLALVPEGMAWDPVHERLLVGSVGRRKIIALDDRGARDFVSPSAGGLLSVYGLRVDQRRKVVWVANNADPAAAGFQPDERGVAALSEIGLDGAIRRRFNLPRDGTSHLFNDVALAPDGGVLVTDTLGGGVWRLAPDGVGLEPFIPVGTLQRPNGITFSADGDRLFVAHAYGIADVDPLSREFVALRSPRGVSLAGIDGLYATERGLVAVQNGVGFPRVVRFAFGPGGDVAAAEVLESKNPLFAVPTTGAIHHGAFYFLANTNLGRGAPAASPPLIFRTGLPPERGATP